MRIITISIIFFLTAINSILFGQSLIFKTVNGEKEFPKDYSPQGPERGSVFPDFNFTDIHGDTIAFHTKKDKVVVINIWFVGCTGCKQEEPQLKRLVSSFETNDEVEFISFCMSNEGRINRY